MSEASPRILHPGLEGHYQPEWSHVQALGKEGQLDLRRDDSRSGWVINIPTQVLDAYVRGDPFAVNLPPGANRIHALMDSPATGVVMNVHGGYVNFTHASRNFSQTINAGPAAGDRQAFRTALEELGLSPDDITELSGALDEDQEAAGELTFGDRAEGWMGRFSARASEGVAVGAVVDLIKQYVGSVT